MSAPEHLRAAVESLSAAAGIRFEVSDDVVPGTELYLVYTPSHPLPERYNQRSALLGFRVPRLFPDAAPEDSFFLQTAELLRLAAPDPVRNNTDVHRAALTPDLLRGTPLEARQALVFSWHIWNKSPWIRGKHTLVDHYSHCIRRFDIPEHDV